MLELNANLFELVVILVGLVFCIIVLWRLNEYYDRRQEARLRQVRSETALLQLLSLRAKQLEEGARAARLEAESLLVENRALADLVVKLKAELRAAAAGRSDRDA